jgi:hypothetical protein
LGSGSGLLSSKRRPSEESARGKKNDRFENAAQKDSFDVFFMHIIEIFLCSILNQ